MNDIYSSTMSVADQKQTRNQAEQEGVGSGSSEFTEVFSWGSDRHGQLGLGKQGSSSKQFHTVPRFCSYNIPISQISCGQSHSVFITSTQLVYSMGSNSQGQLGIDDPYTQEKSSPVLVETLVGQKPLQLASGNNHTLVLLRSGEVLAWGGNENGQCGTGNEPFQAMVHWGPKPVKLSDFSNPRISSINCGGNHSALIDDIGRLFMCGRGDSGQVGNASYQDEINPYFISRIPDKVQEVACGEEHTIILTRSGEIFSMGSNQKGQLGTGPPSRGSNTPTLIKELTFIRMTKVRAGSFSASLSSDNQLYIWGSGSFGDFFTPHRVKSVQNLDIADFQIGRSGFATLLTRQGAVHTWGVNDCGQLGHRDTIQRNTPHKIEALDTKRVTSLSLGKDFVVALGLTLPSKDNAKVKHDYDSQAKPERMSEGRGRHMNTVEYKERFPSKSATKTQFGHSSGGYDRGRDASDSKTYTPLRSSPQRSKSGSRGKHSGNKSATRKHKLQETIEYKAPTAIHEQVVNTLRREKDTIKLALHQEKNQMRIIHNENDELRRQLLDQERDLRDQKATNLKLMDELKHSQIKGNQDYSLHMQQRNSLNAEIDQLKLKIHDQDALIKELMIEQQDMAHQQDHTKHAMEVIKRDVDAEIQKNEELKQDLWREMDLRKHQEMLNGQLQQDLEKERANQSDRLASDSQEIASLHSQIKDLKYQNDELYRKFSTKTDDQIQTQKELDSWREVVERLNNENTELKQIVEDLEDKNRRLVQSLNDQIYQKATEYKERTLQALTRSESPSKLLRILNGGVNEQRLNQVIKDENKPPGNDIYSPLKRGQPMTQGRGLHNYNVARELDKLEQKSYMPHGVDDSDFKRDTNPTRSPMYNQNTIQPHVSDYSPLRAKKSPSPQKQVQFATKEERIDDNFRRVKESCDRIANVLGFNSIDPQGAPLRSQFSGQQPATSSQSKTPTDFLSPSRRNDETAASNFYNPTSLGNSTIQPSQSQTATNFASTMVRQSLQDLRQKLDQMQKERAAVENSLSAYEDRRSIQ